MPLSSVARDRSVQLHKAWSRSVRWRDVGDFVSDSATAIARAGRGTSSSVGSTCNGAESVIQPNAFSSKGTTLAESSLNRGLSYLRENNGSQGRRTEIAGTLRHALRGFDAWRSILVGTAGASRPAGRVSTRPLLIGQWPSRTFSTNPNHRGGNGRRHVDSRGMEHFRQRGASAWLQKVPPGRYSRFSESSDSTFFHTLRSRLSPEVVIVGGVMVVGGGLWFYRAHVEEIPYTHRRHFILLSPAMEKQLGEAAFQELKSENRRALLPPTSLDSLRVQRVAARVVEAAVKQAGQDAPPNITYASPFPSKQLPPSSPSPSRSSAKPHGSMTEAVRSEEGGVGGGGVGGMRDEEEQMLADSKWLEHTRQSGSPRSSHPFEAHLRDLHWEVVVLDSPSVNACCLPGGKIAVFTGLLRKFQRDDELAMVIGHEVGHIVARHSAERATSGVLLSLLQLVVVLFVVDLPGLVSTTSNLLFSLPFSRMHELEADRIGLFIAADAGYNPAIAPSVYERLEESTSLNNGVGEYLSTHPAAKRRAELLRHSETMREAMRMYEESVRRRGMGQGGAAVGYGAGGGEVHVEAIDRWFR